MTENENCPKCGTKEVLAPGIDYYCPNPDCKQDNLTPEECLKLYRAVTAKDAEKAELQRKLDSSENIRMAEKKILIDEIAKNTDLESKLRKAEEERDKHIKYCDEWEEDYLEMKEKANSFEGSFNSATKTIEDQDEKIRTLWKYADHKGDCRRFDIGKPCTCGFKELRASYEGKEGGK